MSHSFSSISVPTRIETTTVVSLGNDLRKPKMIQREAKCLCFTLSIKTETQSNTFQGTLMVEMYQRYGMVNICR